MEQRKYVKPTVIHIEQTPEAETLYKLEHQRDGLIIACAHEWAKIRQIPKSEFWTRSLPQQLFDLLDSFEHGASKAAAEAYLEYLQHREG